jgi:hypothetical protein
MQTPGRDYCLLSPDGLLLDVPVNLVKLVYGTECCGNSGGLKGEACNLESEVESAMLVIVAHNEESINWVNNKVCSEI